jgi:predicted deacylase
MHGEQLKTLAKAFGAPVALHSAAPEGSLRRAASEYDVPILVYESGEALRFDEVSIRIGLRGVMNVMREMGMITLKRKLPKSSAILRSSTWVRAPYSGVVRPQVKLGDMVGKGDVLGVVSDPVGEEEFEMVAPYDGVVIGRTHLPLTYEGEAIFHIGRTGRTTALLEKHLDSIQDTEQLTWPELVEEPEIV